MADIFRFDLSENFFFNFFNAKSLSFVGGNSIFLPNFRNCQRIRRNIILNCRQTGALYMYTVFFDNKNFFSWPNTFSHFIHSQLFEYSNAVL